MTFKFPTDFYYISIMIEDISGYTDDLKETSQTLWNSNPENLIQKRSGFYNRTVFIDWYGTWHDIMNRYSSNDW